MSDLVIVDTDILIDAGRGVEPAVNFLASQEKPGVSTITQMELIVGCRSKVELRQLEQFLRHFQIIPLSENISRLGIELLTEYKLSHGLLIADALIAATAISVNGLLASKNQRDYRFIDKLNLLPYN